MTAPRKSWAQQRRIVSDRLRDGGIESSEAEARWLTETASGYAGAEWLSIAAQAPNERAQRHLDAMVERRLGGEPHAMIPFAFAGGFNLGLDGLAFPTAGHALIVPERGLIERDMREGDFRAKLFRHAAPKIGAC